jgi:multicomponent Na+:H+ antiporter subunit G
MLDILYILGFVLIFLGSLFLLLSAIGLLRLTCAITQIHVGTKATTLGTLLVISGAICIEPTLWLKLSLLALFILLTNPLSSSILAKSSYRKDGFFSKTKVDEMKDI